MKAQKIFTTLLLLVLVQFTFAQTSIIKGVVSDNNGPLPGVAVIIKNTSTGTETDFDGNYSLQAKKGEILVFSFVGMKSKEVVVGNTATINVKLEEESSTLEEVVIVGYTSKEKKKLTSAVATVDNKLIADRPVATFDNALQGVTPGLLVSSGSGQPGATSSITLRGQKSFALSSSPLYILDGQQISSSDFSGLNPNDIDSISVLKDAAATQIYGSRGANGVIVITSKSGKQGKTKFTYSTQFGVSIAPGYNKGLQPLSSSQLIDLQQEIGIGPTVGESQEVLDQLRNINEDWLDVLTRDGITKSHELSVSGGNENTRFFLSGSYFGQEGVSIRSKLDRYSFRSKVDYKKNRLTLGANVYLSYTDIEDSESEGSFSRSNPFYSAIRVPAYDRAIDPETGDYAEPYDPSASSTRNVLERIETNDEDIAYYKATLNLNGKYDFGFLEGLSFKTRWGLNFRQRNSRVYTDPSSIAGGREQGGQGRLSHGFQNDVDFTGTNSLHYNFDINNEHKFNIGLYQEFVATYEDDVSLSVYGLNPVITNISGATEGTAENGFIPGFGGGKSKNTLVSYFTTIDYSYLGKYNITAGLRRDGSSKFGDNNKFGNFYSVGLGWVVSDENFFSSVKAINFLKFRASYGTVGNQRFSATLARESYSLSSYDGNNGLVPSIADPNVKWEETAKANIGFDMRMLQSRLSLTLDVYQEKTTNLFQEVPISITNGFSSIFKNVGSLKNEGIELQINSDNIKTADFTWSTGFNIATNETTILKLNDGESFRSGYFLLEEGAKYPVFNLVKRAGVNPVNGRYLWYDKDGNLTEEYDPENAVNVGRATPKYFGGLSNSFSYKGIELQALFSFSQGKKIYNVVRTSLDNPSKVSRGSVSTNALRFWRQPGDITDIPDPRQISNYFTDSGWLEDASFIKLKNVMLSYRLPDDVLKNLNLSGLRLFVQGQNLYTWTKFTGFDPENSSPNYVADYPSFATYTIGLNVNF